MFVFRKTVKDGVTTTTTIHTNGGNYTEKIEGDFIAGTVINSGEMPPKRRDLSKDRPSIGVGYVEVDL